MASEDATPWFEEEHDVCSYCGADEVVEGYPFCEECRDAFMELETDGGEDWDKAWEMRRENGPPF